MPKYKDLTGMMATMNHLTAGGQQGKNKQTTGGTTGGGKL